MSFASGFNAGFNAVTTARDQKKKDEEYEFEKAERDRQREGQKAFKEFMEQDYATPAPANPVVAGGVQNPAHGGEQAPAAGGPMAGGTQAGAAAQPQSKFKMPDMQMAQQRISQASKLAAQHPELADQLKNYTDHLRGASLSQHAQQFQGDPTQDPVGYMRHMAQGTAMLGDYMTPEQAKEQAKYIKQMKKEGFTDALQALKMGDLEGANQSWNQAGALRGTITNVRDEQVNMYGVPVAAKVFDVVDESGKVTGTYNTAHLEHQAEVMQKQVEFAGKTKKATADIKNTESQIADRAADNKREDKKVKASMREVIQDSGATHIVDKDTQTSVKIPGMGGKPSSKGSGKDKHGRSNSDVMAQKKRATGEFQTSVGIKKGELGIQGLKPAHQKLYSSILPIVDAEIEQNGINETAAAKLGKAVWDRAMQLEQDGEKDFINMAIREYESTKKQKKTESHSSMWK